MSSFPDSAVTTCANEAVRQYHDQAATFVARQVEWSQQRDATGEVTFWNSVLATLTHATSNGTSRRA